MYSRYIVMELNRVLTTAAVCESPFRSPVWLGSLFRGKLQMSMPFDEPFSYPTCVPVCKQTTKPYLLVPDTAQFFDVNYIHS